MTSPIPPLPAEGASLANGTPWYSHYTALDAAVRQLQALYAALTPAGGFVSSINGITPNPSGAVALANTDVGALADSYHPSLSDAPAGTRVEVLKDTVTGFWPSGYDPTTGAPIYTGGSASSGVRPTARTDIFVDWIGADPSPTSVASGTGGPLRGVDTRSIPIA